MISTLRTQDGLHFLTAELDGTVNATRTEEQLGAWQDWDVLPDPFGDAAVRVLKSCDGLYLSAYRPEYCVEIGVPEYTVRASATGADIWERWRVAIDGDVVRLQSCDSGLWLSPQQIDTDHPQAGGAGVLCNGPEPAGWETLFPSDMSVFGSGGYTPAGGAGVVRLLDGYLRQQGRGVADNSGVRLAHGCSDFCALAKFNEDRDTYCRNLDTTARYQQFTRVGWRVNGWVFDERALNVDPYKHGWWESALRGVLQAHRDRGLKVKLSSFDMNNWSDSQAMESFQRVAQIASEYGDTVWASAVTNEIAGTWEPGECDENIARGHELMDAYRAIYPGGLHTISDPENRDKTGMQKLAVTLALIHQNGHTIDDLVRRTFNDFYENDPGVPIDSDEPRGPNGPQGGDVTASVEDPDELFALYTVQVAIGEISTYFNSPGCAERRPLDDTYGFKELPQLWRDLEVPEDISQGSLGAGHTGTGMMLVKDTHAARADGVTHGPYNLGFISGQHDGQPWAVKANRDGQWSIWYAAGKAWEGHLSNGQVIPTSRGFTPAVVRALT